MESIKEIEQRRSIRKYKEREVGKEDLVAILRAAMLAPSSKNRQPWKFLVYTKEAKREILEAMEKGLVREKDSEVLMPESAAGLPDAFRTLEIMKEAPVLVLVLNTLGSSPFETISTDGRIGEICNTLSIGAAIQNILLEAEHRGLGTLWIANTFFAYPELAEAVGTQHQLVCAVSIGYADEQPYPRPRKAFDDVVEYRV